MTHDEDLLSLGLADAKTAGRKKTSVPEQPGCKAGRQGPDGKNTSRQEAAGRTAPRLPWPLRPHPNARALAAGDYTGMDRRTADRVPQRQMAIRAAGFDLHGMYQEPPMPPLE